MRICILSKDNVPLGFMDNELPEALHFYDDKLHVYLKGTAHTYEFTVRADHEDAQLIEVGNKIAFYYKERPYYLNIVNTEHDETEIKAEAWAFALELLNETAKAYSGTSMTFEAYLKAMIYSSKDMLEVGVNEVSDKKISNEWTGTTDTLLKRLYSLAEVFDAELEFVPRLNDDYSLDTIVMNVYKEHSDTAQGVGERRTDANFRYGEDITGITKTQDITNLYTCIRPTGAEDLTITGVGDKTYKNDDGEIEYFHKSGSGLIYAPLACLLFPSTVSGTDKYICYNWQTDYKDANTLFGNALAKLKTLCIPESTYEIKGSIDVNIGDTITVIDESFTPKLYLETRVTEQEISFTDPTKNSTTFENTKELDSKIDDDLTKRVEALAKEQAATAQAAAEASTKAEVASTAAENAATKAEAASTTATEAKETAETANTAATEAKTTATEASNTATAASKAASSAETKASSAETKAASAETKAATATTTANEANKAAAEAETKASAATDIATGASEDASSAATKAETATATANEAKETAATASETATAANTTAEAAQTTANTANATAEAASTTATEAKTTAETAKAATDELNTLIRETDEGVEVAKIDSEGGYVGMRTEQTSDAYLIKDADGNTLASYGASKVELGKGNSEASISMCDGLTEISTEKVSMAGVETAYGKVTFPDGYGYVKSQSGDVYGGMTTIATSLNAEAELTAKMGDSNPASFAVSASSSGNAASIQAEKLNLYGASKMGSWTINDLIDALNHLEWKLIGSATGTASISFDMSKYKELFYVIYPYDSATSRQPYAWSKNVLTKFFEVETDQMRFDFIRSEASTRAWGWISKALGTARMGGVLYNGNDVTSYSKLYLYGR